MSNSDSEEFESADEDFEEEKNKKKIKNNENISVNKNIKDDEKSIDIVINKKEEISEKKIEECFNIETENDKKKEQICKTKPQTHDEQENVAKVEKSQTNIKNRSRTECVTPPLREVCWEFDDWTEDKVENSEPVPKVHDESGDGWDIEDWGENIEEKFESKTPSNYNSFPVINEINKQGSSKFKIDEPRNEYFKTNSSPKEQHCSDVLDKLISKDNAKSQSWGWKPWGGVVSLFSTASESVASLTTNVSKVIESGIGNIPDPEQLARIHKEELKKNCEQKSETKEQPSETIEEKVSSLGNIVTQISNRVISGGLDTLEGIGKKTMTILQENDPGLINKRKMLGFDNDRPVLSQVLREAKQKTEETEHNLKQMQKQHYKKQLHFETLFDDYHGLVHLEALEMLSKQSSLKLQTLLTPLTGKALAELQETLNEVLELCELPDQDSEDADGLHSVDDLSEKLSSAVEDLGISVDFKEILRCWEENTNWLIDNPNMPTGQEVHDKALHCLAQSTALAVNKMHKLAEMILILDHHSTANEADCFVQLTTVFCWHLSGIASRFSDKLTENGATEDVNSLIVSIFYEGSNCNNYIQKTFQLFVPILQIGAA